MTAEIEIGRAALSPEHTAEAEKYKEEANACFKSERN